ncbi:unnamed protein product [Camellia sinensis]
MSEKEKMNKENTHRQSSEPEEKNKEREVTTEREDGRKETEETYARKEHFHPSTSSELWSWLQRRNQTRQSDPDKALNSSTASIRFHGTLLSPKTTTLSLSLLALANSREGGFLSLEEIDESEYGLEIPKPERENKKQRTKENKNEKKRKHSEVEDELGGEVEAVSEEKDNKVERKKKKKKKKKKNKDAKNSEENEEPTAETRQAFTPEQINEACYVDINSNKAVFDSLRNNPKVNYDGMCFAYKSKHALKDKNQLLILIRKFPEGIAVIDLKDAYPTVMEDLQV